MRHEDVKIIAVDFDGTLVEHKFPEIGTDLPLAIKTVIDLQRRGKRIILWTCRTGNYLELALRFLYSKGVIPNAVNTHVDLSSCTLLRGPKPYYDMCIDDTNFPLKPVDWKAVRDFFELDK